MAVDTAPLSYYVGEGPLGALLALAEFGEEIDDRQASLITGLLRRLPRGEPVLQISVSATVREAERWRVDLADASGVTVVLGKASRRLFRAVTIASLVCSDEHFARTLRTVWSYKRLAISDTSIPMTAWDWIAKQDQPPDAGPATWIATKFEHGLWLRLDASELAPDALSRVVVELGEENGVELRRRPEFPPI